MKLIKLDAIDSTNDFLKELLIKNNPENFTVVSAESQTKGKGQMGAVWTSETGKNLTFSVLFKGSGTGVQHIFSLNIAVATAIVSVLENYEIPNLSIKWPNDIMADSKKVGGILIENIIKSSDQVNSIIGVGLNVNQHNFQGLPKASSLSLATNTEFDKDRLLVEIVEEIKKSVANLPDTLVEDVLWKKYLNILFKKGIPMPFENNRKERFMGIIQNVNTMGQLELLLEDDSIQSYGIKEIQMLY